MRPYVLVEQNTEHQEQEEAIVPVKPGLRGVRPGATLESPERTRGPLLLGAVLVTLLAVAVVVIFLLPGWVADRQSERPEEPAPVSAAAPEPVGPVLTPEEIEALRMRAEALLVELLNQQGRLESQAAADWGGGDWEHYRELSRAGDDAYLANAFDAAVAEYSAALEIGESLLGRSAEIIVAALDAGAQALQAGNAQLAAEQYRLVLSIDADDAVAQAGLRRAERLPEVLALVQDGEEHERGARLGEAAQAYREALAIDGQWVAARSALTSVTARIRDREFDALMSQGFGALTEEEFSEAHERFTAALLIRPDSREAMDGQVQAEAGRNLDQIALVEARALAFERRELWERAIQQYQDALATDATLVFAQQGQERAQLRADLDAKLSHLIANPNLLFGDRVLADAGELLSQARGVEDAGPRLVEQMTSLDRLVRLASTPVTVELQSDELTAVTLYRVGQLGTFLVKEIQLRPGTYTAVGSRDGYRDVRESFTVLPGRELSPIRVECIEPI